MSNAAQTPVTFDVPCLMCGASAEDARMSVTCDTGEFHCASCDERYTPQAVADRLSQWDKLVNWAFTHPAHASK